MRRAIGSEGAFLYVDRGVSDIIKRRQADGVLGRDRVTTRSESVYGVPADLDLRFLHGAELIQVRLGAHQVQFHFHPDGSICVEGGWELLDRDGVQIDHNCEEAARPPYQLHRLLAHRIVTSEVCAPEWFALRFDGGEVLRILDDSDQYESFQIEPGDIIV